MSTPAVEPPKSEPKKNPFLDSARAAGARVHSAAESTVVRLAGPVPPLSSDDGRAEIRRGALAMFLFFVLFLGFAAFCPLDAAVVAHGYVAVSGSRETLQHRDGGVVSRVAVVEGQRVKAGDILIELAAGETLAQERALFSQVIDLQIRRQRLWAEGANSTEMQRPAEWASMTSDDQAAAEAIWQRNLSETAGPRRTWSQFDARISGYNQEISALNRQATLINDELEGMRSLAAENLVPLTRVRALERQLAEIDGRRGELRAEIAATRETRSGQLREVEAKLAEATPQWVAAHDRLEQTRLRAPNAGVIVGLMVHNAGAVVRPGERVLDVVPDGRELVVEARLAPEDADDVTIGMNAEVKITAFSGRNLPILNGRVRDVSADRFTDERTGQPYFLTHVVVSAQELRDLAESSNGARQLRAGLPAQIVAPTRKRTMLQYILEPLNQTLWRSFREH